MRLDPVILPAANNNFPIINNVRLIVVGILSNKTVYHVLKKESILYNQPFSESSAAPFDLHFDI